MSLPYPSARRPGAISWAELIAETRQVLAGSGAGHPEGTEQPTRIAQEARWLVEEAAGTTDLAEMRRPATTRRVAHLDAMVRRRLDGEPIQHVLGHWAFRGLDLVVDRRALIPRPETEVLVDVVLDALAATEPAGTAPVVVDLGTGTGAIALSVVSEHPTAEVWATDVSSEALAVARANAAGLAGRGATRLRLVEGSWFGALPEDLSGRVDLVVANPPYVAEDEALPATVSAWEPAIALWGGPTGTDHLEHIVEQVPSWLAPGGWIVVEHAPAQAGAVAAFASSRGLVGVTGVADLTARTRFTRARRPRAGCHDSTQQQHREW